MPFYGGSRYPIVGGSPFPGPWIHQGWTVNGVWSPNPSGVEQLSNPTMAAPYVAGLANGWLKSGSPTLSEENIIVYGVLTSSQKVIATLADQGIYQDKSSSSNDWYKTSVWVYPGVINGVKLYYGATGNKLSVGTGAWENLSVIYRGSSINRPFIASNSANTFYIGLTSTLKLNLSSLIAIRNFGRQVGFIAPLNMTPGFPAAVRVRQSDGNNFVEIYYDGSYIDIVKVIGGTRSTLSHTACAYVAGALIEARWASADVVQAWYNGIKRNGDQSVADVPVGTYAGMFGTDNSVQFSNPQPIY